MLHRTNITLGLVLTAALLDSTAHPELARACSGPCSQLAVVPREGNVAPDGTTLLACSSCSDAPPPLEAVDGSGKAHAGESSELAHEEPGWPITSRTYFAWRPAEPLQPGDYRLRAVDLEGDENRYCSLETFDAEIHVPAPGDATEPLPEVVLALGTADRGAGTAFECTGICESPVTDTRSQRAPYLEHQLPTPADHPARAFYLVRLVGRTEDGEIEGPWWALDAVDEPSYAEDGSFVVDDEQRGGVTFPAVQEEYCAEIELFDVVKDTRTRIDAGCVQHDLEADQLRTRPFFFTCERFADAGADDYVDAFCRDNEAACENSDAAECDAFHEHCSSLGCRVAGRADSSALAWLMLLAPWFWLRRRCGTSAVR